jgi:hypothetical protein
MKGRDLCRTERETGVMIRKLTILPEKRRR